MDMIDVEIQNQWMRHNNSDMIVMGAIIFGFGFGERSIDGFLSLDDGFCRIGGYSWFWEEGISGAYESSGIESP